MIHDLHHWPLAFALLALAMLLDWKRAPVEWGDDRPPPFLGIANWIVQIALLIISSIISAALAPKPKPPEAQKADVPEVKDGKRVVRLYGACWIKEPAQLAMKQIDPPEPIKQKPK